MEMTKLDQGGRNTPPNPVSEESGRQYLIFYFFAGQDNIRHSPEAAKSPSQVS